MYIKKSLLTSIAILATTGVAQSETVLTVSTWASPNHSMNSKTFPRLDKMLQECTEGDLSLKLEFGLAPVPAQYDTVRDGVADITWIVPGYTPGKFVTMMLAELPGNAGNAEEISAAYQMTYDEYLAAANEAKGVEVLANFVHGPGLLNMIKPLENGYESVAGKKIRVGSGVGAMVATALDMASVNVPAPAVYETLASGVADGVLFPAESIAAFKVAELTKYSYSNPDGMYTTAFSMLMNSDSYEGLSEDHRKCVDEIRGVDLARAIGRDWDAADQLALDAADKNGVEIIEFDADQRAFFKEKTADLEANVIERVNAVGVDALAALAFLRMQLDSKSNQ